MIPSLTLVLRPQSQYFCAIEKLDAVRGEHLGIEYARGSHAEAQVTAPRPSNEVVVGIGVGRLVRLDSTMYAVLAPDWPSSHQ